MFLRRLSLLLCLLVPASGAAAATRIAVIGDFGQEGSNAQAVANMVHSWEPNVVVTLGDNSYDNIPIDRNIGQYYARYIGNYPGSYGPGSPTNRFFPLLGNHDYSDGGRLQAYLDYFTLPGASIQTSNTSGNERYYDFIVGPIHFFAVNSNAEEPDGRTSSSLQAQWLRAQMAASRSAWKIVLLHHSPYSSGSSHGNDSNMQWPFAAWGADAVLAGHNHVYERLLVDGIPYFVNGLGGRNLKGFGTPKPQSVVRYADDFGAMLLEADTGSFSFEFYSLSDSLVDTFTLVGHAPDLAVEPVGHDYGDVLVEAVRTAHFVVTNHGLHDLELDGALVMGPDSLDFTVSFEDPPTAPRRGGATLASSAPITLAPGASTGVAVSFRPGTLGPKSGTLRLVSDDPDEGVMDLSLNGTGLAPPDLIVTPLALDYGTLLLPGSANRSLHVRNQGSLDLQVTAAWFTGPNAAQFSIAAGEAPLTVSPGDSADMVVHFAPTSAGAKSASLWLASNDPGRPVAEIPVAGLAALPAPDIVASPAPLDFGAILSSTNVSRSVRVRNRGTATLNVTASTIVGANVTDFTVTSGTAPFTLAPGDSTDLVVRFAPTSAGPKTSALRLASNDPDAANLDVPLSGTALQPVPEIDVAPTSVDFGTIVALTTTSRSLRVRNLGTGSLDVTAASFTGTNAAEFSLTSGAVPFTLAPGDSTALVVRFAPTSAGAKPAALRLASNDADEALVDVSLSGTALPAPEPEILVFPGSQDFGGVFVDGGVSTVSIEVRNDGEANLQVSGLALSGPSAPDFTLPNGTGPFTLAPGAFTSLTVAFRPATAGTKSATLRISSNDPEQSQLDVALTGIGVSFPGTPGTIVFQQSVSGTKTGSSTLTSASITGVADQTYLAAISTKPHVAATGLTGLGLAWTRVRAQCGGRAETGAEVWLGTGNPSSGAVTATLASAPSSAAIILARYSDVDTTAPLGSFVSGNTNGLNGGCDNGTDGTSYSLPLQTSAQNARVFAAVAKRNRDHTPGSGYTLRNQTTAGSGGNMTGLDIMDRGFTTPGAFTVNGTFNAGVDWAVVGVEMRPRLYYPDITVSPGSHDYGTQAVGSTVSTAFTIRNDGSANLQLPGIGLYGPQATAFSLAGGPAGPTLAPGASHVVGVSFVPVTAGTKSAVLRIVSDDPDEASLDFPLLGNAVVFEPDVAVSPVSHDYGAVVLGSTASRSVHVSNLGNVALQVSATSLVGAAAAEFAVTSGAAPFSVAPGDIAEVVVGFTAASIGVKTATLRLASNDPDESPFDVSLAATAVVPDIAVTPIAYDFGAVILGAPSSGSIRVRNLGSASLQVTGTSLLGANASEFAVTSGAAPFGVAPGDSADVVVRFTPAALGAKAATLRLASDDPDENPLDVSLTAVAVAPDIAVDPASKNFGNVTVGAHTWRRFRVHNLGNTPLQVSAVTVLGPNASEFILNASANPFTLAVGDSTDIIVRFSPSTTGTKTATMRIASNDPDENPFDVSLSGTGLAPPAPDIDVSPVGHDFGAVPVFTNASRSMRVRNLGAADLQVTATSVVGTDSLQFAVTAGAAPFALAPGDSAEVQIMFTPTTMGAKSAILRLASNDPDENPLDLSLAGNGDPPLEGMVVFEASARGTKTSSSTVTTSSSLAAVSGHLYLAAISSKPSLPVSNVTGLGLTWTRLRAQCSGRSQTSVEVWRGSGTPTTGTVTATFASAATSAVIVVSRYSGADPASPLGGIVSANTEGVSGGCSGGDDGTSYSMSLPTTVPDARVFVAVGMRNRDHTPGSGYVLRDEISAGSGGDAAGVAVVDKEFATPGTAGVGGTFSGSVDWVVVAVEIRPLLGPAKPVTASAAGAQAPSLAIRHGLGSTIPGVDLAAARPLGALVRIFDVRGRLVETLWNGMLPAGRKRLDWSAHQRSGRAVPPGIYFVHAEIDGRALTGKLVLLR